MKCIENFAPRPGNERTQNSSRPHALKCLSGVNVFRALENPIKAEKIERTRARVDGTRREHKKARPAEHSVAVSMATRHETSKLVGWQEERIKQRNLLQ